jgi:gliding motility-associated lipoprotein GldB
MIWEKKLNYCKMPSRYFNITSRKGGLGLLFALTFALFSCEKTPDGKTSIEKKITAIFSSTPECDDIDVSKTMTKVQVVRLEDEIMKLKSKEEAEKFLRKYPELAKNFFLENHFPQGKVAENLYLLAKDTAITTIYKQTKQQYGDISDLQNQFEDAFAHIKFYYPQFVVPKIYTVITGLGIETYVSDSVIVLSLDFFLGKTAKYKPRDHSGQPFPEYILRRYQKHYIVPTCMLYISNKYNKVDMLENTLLAEMVYFGKAYHFVKKMMPCADDSLIIGYTGEQLEDTKNHESVIWGFFVEHKLLYETSHFIKTKYTGERPYTAEIGPKCPGKIGTWLGWRIVDEYFKHSNGTFQQMMEMKSAKKLFLESKYKPQKDK